MMDRNRKILTAALSAMFVLACAAPLFSQQKQASPDVMVFQRKVGPEGAGPVVAPGDENFIYVSSEMSFDGKVVKAAPYSAQAVTEVTQTLSDGNRIVNKSVASIYRDSEGRTRREQTLRAIGPFATASEPPQTVFINDPVTGVSYALDSHSRVARKMFFRFDFKYAPGDAPKLATSVDNVAPPAVREKAEESDDVIVRAAPLAPVKVMTAPDAGAPALAGSGDVFARTIALPEGPEGGIVMEYHGSEDKKANTESLGKQNIEGVEADGTRTTVTIAAGLIGNEQPIQIVSERWYSPALQTVVMTRHSDPRFGETVYRLTNINRSEPAKSLFEVPADYTIKEGPTVGPLRVRTRKAEQ
jgi:hypothetical protein